MKRVAFETMVTEALTRLSSTSPIRRVAPQRTSGVGGVRYGDLERRVARNVALLASRSPTRFKPIAIAAPELVPPCF